MGRSRRLSTRFHGSKLLAYLQSFYRLPSPSARPSLFLLRISVSNVYIYKRLRFDTMQTRPERNSYSTYMASTENNGNTGPIDNSQQAADDYLADLKAKIKGGQQLVVAEPDQSDLGTTRPPRLNYKETLDGGSQLSSGSQVCCKVLCPSVP